jgi:hypothetical protein
VGALRNSAFAKLMINGHNGSVQLKPIVVGVDMEILTLITGGESYDHKQLTVLRTDKMNVKIEKLKEHLINIVKIFSDAVDIKEGVEIVLEELQRDSENVKNKR